ncbi:PH domain-containing protein [Pseudoduganella sp. SL102]|uniref:PH domain-containing protein n=1 Tax=Pseudoduganella sp. SL102 TaxID=2995154 RepID=UPI00248A97A7|nr:PH domain-containing protein [Pseudoduganella sp. SL102]WBS00511.1 PH domain-containing protein [Pseudoduganella sp. SL102]
MFKKFAADALGISDVGVIVGPADYNKVDADDYLFSEDGEQIFFLIKSKMDEYCFTNLALIHVDGDSAVSSKRTIKRYEYASHQISGVSIETAGTLDMDIELKFALDETRFSIDVKKSFIEQLKDVYKALITIGKQQRRDAVCRKHALQALEATTSVHKLNIAPEGGTLTTQFNALLDALNTAVLDTHTKRDFSDVFTKYIHN